MLYQRKSEERLDSELFKNPTREYRGTPFWSWNGRLKREALTEQIKVFKEMGFGGFHAHSRTGLDTEYLGAEFMDCIRHCTEISEKEGMLTWLYDEDRWPSGYAGGLLTKDPKHRARFLCFTSSAMENSVGFEEAYITGKPYLLGAYDIILKDGFMESYKKIAADGKAEGLKKYAYVCTPENDPWFNNQTYSNTLSRDTIKEFVKLTHEKYKQAAGDKFSTVIPAIFIDEPQFTRKLALDTAQSDKAGILPWSMDLEETFFKACGCRISDRIPELFLEKRDSVSTVRYNYHNHTAERFAEALADVCGDWCEQNGIMLTGHMADEDTLRGQNNYSGDAMRGFRSFQMPGMDMLCNKVFFTTAKQAQSAAHQYGREGVLSELYGVTNWDFDFRGHKFQGDWQAAMGITVRVPHLSMMTMAGEAKRDYPASISYQSPWYKEYSYIEDHFARINTALVRGEPLVDVAVVHPIESYWLYFGTNDLTLKRRNELDGMFGTLSKWLVGNLIDYDYINEALLTTQDVETGDRLKVGSISYKTVIVAGCDTIRSSTLKILKDFSSKGGNVIFAGHKPIYIDAEKAADEYLASAEEIPFEENAVIKSVEEVRRVDILNSDGSRTDNLVHCFRKDGKFRWLFVAHSKEPDNKDALNPQNITVKLRGEYGAELYDTLSGEIYAVPVTVKNGFTEINRTVYSYDSLLLRLCPVSEAKTFEDVCAAEKKKTVKSTDAVEYRLEEPNVLLLDYAEYKLDDEPWNPKEEILRLDNSCRKKLSYPLRYERLEQQWAVEKEKVTHRLWLRFVIDSKIEVDNALIALENAETAEIYFNGTAVKSEVCGFYVDKDIKTVNLPTVSPGENELIIAMPYAKHINVEYCYLLGDFGVEVVGEKAQIAAKQSLIKFGDITRQGLPFYGGNITYICDIETVCGEFEVNIPYYRGSVISVSVDGEKKGLIAFDPYRLKINTAAGRHRLEITLYGNRYNTFGGLHNSNKKDIWYGPNYWRTTGDNWSDSYILKPTGILSKPAIRE